MGLLSTMLSGAAYGTELGDMVHGPRAGQDGHFVMALDVAAFESADRFRARVDGVVRQIRDGRRVAGVDRLYAPGHLEAETEAGYRRDGIPLNAATVAGLRAEAERQGVDAAASRIGCLHGRGSPRAVSGAGTSRGRRSARRARRPRRPRARGPASTRSPVSAPRSKWGHTHQRPNRRAPSQTAMSSPQRKASTGRLRAGGRGAGGHPV